MQSAMEIKHLTREEKLRIMEAIWEDLSREEELVDSPAWHKQALRETELRLSTGEEKMVDWHGAKRRLG